MNAKHVELGDKGYARVDPDSGDFELREIPTGSYELNVKVTSGDYVFGTPAAVQVEADQTADVFIEGAARRKGWFRRN